MLNLALVLFSFHRERNKPLPFGKDLFVSLSYFSSFVILFNVKARVEVLCKNAEVVGGIIPTMPSTINAVLNDIIER